MVKRLNEVRQKATPRRERDRQGRDGRNARAAGGLNEDSPVPSRKCMLKDFRVSNRKAIGGATYRI